MIDVETTVVDAPQWGTTRAEALSDGVFAIAMTLLVLEIKVPELPRQAAPIEVWHGVMANGPVFFSFVLTFVLSGLFWFLHHATFHALEKVDRGVCWINIAFLMFVSLLPFSTALLAAFPVRQPVSLGFYFGNQFALGLMLNLLWEYGRRRGLLRPGGQRRIRRAIAVQPLVCGVTLALLPFRPEWCMNTFSVLQVGANLLVRRRRRGDPR
jgi:uncharacterized membrane protein